MRTKKYISMVILIVIMMINLTIAQTDIDKKIEVDDYISQKIKITNYNYSTIDHIIYEKIKDFFEYYNLTVPLYRIIIYNKQSDIMGYTWPGSRRMYLNSWYNDINITIIHELQHYRWKFVKRDYYFNKCKPNNMSLGMCKENFAYCETEKFYGNNVKRYVAGNGITYNCDY